MTLQVLLLAGLAVGLIMWVRTNRAVSAPPPESGVPEQSS
jgi:hypothetical protein